MSEISAVYVFPNGQCMVFDREGRQMPEYQGRTAKVIEKIIRAGYRGPITATNWPSREALGAPLPHPMDCSCPKCWWNDKK